MPAPKTTKHEMTFDFDGLIQLLAGHLYSEKKVFIRELIQNAHDAIQRRVADDPAFEREQGHIDISTDLTGSGRIIFRDNGIGMTAQDLENFLSTIGKSGTKAAREAAREDDGLSEVIGQFGIGFLSGFVVGSRVEVKTRHWQAAPAAGCLWENAGRADYTLTPLTLPEVGTEVIVHLGSAADLGLIHEDAVKKVIREYADMLRIAIHLNDARHDYPPVNTRIMPWERTGVPADEMRRDAIQYLEKIVPDSVLEAIPIHINDPARADQAALHAEGLLYITRTRVIGRDAPRTVRVFLKRMFLCEEAKEVLPPWASFVNGIINTRSLAPNAARDNFTRDDTFRRLRDRLGDIVIAHLEHLREANPQRLSEILAYHEFGIKAACHYYQPFFLKFGHLLEWRINGKAMPDNRPRNANGRWEINEETGAKHTWATLPEVLANLPPAPGGGAKKLPCFTTHSSANQYFEMADAAGATVLDASASFDSELLSAWAKNNPDQVTLVYVDREDDPAVFRPTEAAQDQAVAQLARSMSAYIRPGGSGRLRVEARRFAPASLPAVLKSSEAAGSAIKARSILSDPDSAADLRKMAEELLRMSRNADMRMNINALNPLIRTLAELFAANPDDDDLGDLMLGVYNDAILYNQELMTPRNAQLFHEQFQRLMGRSVEFVKQKAELRREREDLERQRQAQQPRRAVNQRMHLAAFLMVPFADAFAPTREAVRLVVEDQLGCELRTASDKTFNDFIRGNVEAHMEDADFFIADVTDANPNVMMELGAAYPIAQSRPVILIARVPGAGGKPELPADLGGHIAVTYVADSTAAQIAADLAAGFAKHDKLDAWLKTAKKERFVSAASLRAWSRGLLTHPDIYQRLSAKYPTVGAWRDAQVADLEALLASEADLAGATLKRIQENLPT